jgi:hypothetical protein
MTITAEIWEDSGAVLAGHGTTRISVNNIGWNYVGTPETTDYAYNPIPRSEFSTRLSYTKWNYLKISGTYPTGSRMRLKITGDPNGAPPVGYDGTTGITLKYAITSTYTFPTNAAYPGMTTYVPGEIILPIQWNAIGPESTPLAGPHMTTNTTYYSQYLVTQIEVAAGTDYGNIGEINIMLMMDEYESAVV